MWPEAPARKLRRKISEPKFCRRLLVRVDERAPAASEFMKQLEESGVTDRVAPPIRRGLGRIKRIHGEHLSSAKNWPMPLPSQLRLPVNDGLSNAVVVDAIRSYKLQDPSLNKVFGVYRCSADFGFPKGLLIFAAVRSLEDLGLKSTEEAHSLLIAMRNDPWHA